VGADASPDVFEISQCCPNQTGLAILPNGRVGIGTTSPTGGLDVRSTVGHEVVVRETIVGNAASINMQNTTRNWRLFSDAFPDAFLISPDGPGVADRVFTMLGSSGNVGIGTENPTHPLEMGSGAHVTAGGVWTNASSRAYKENIRDLTSAEARTALDGLTPVRYNYKTDANEDYVGFIAEDVPALVATQDRKGLSPMDVVAVLTKIVQEQNERIAELEARLDARQ
jgi:hypothetical protein